MVFYIQDWRGWLFSNFINTSLWSVMGRTMSPIVRGGRDLRKWPPDLVPLAVRTLNLSRLQSKSPSSPPKKPHQCGAILFSIAPHHPTSNILMVLLVNLWSPFEHRLSFRHSSEDCLSTLYISLDFKHDQWSNVWESFFKQHTSTKPMAPDHPLSTSQSKAYWKDRCPVD